MSRAASGSTAVLEYRPTETLALLFACCLAPRCLSRPCRPASPPKWRKPWAFPETRVKFGERQTVCWRETDSNFRFRARYASLTWGFPCLSPSNCSRSVEDAHLAKGGRFETPVLKDNRANSQALGNGRASADRSNGRVQEPEVRIHLPPGKRCYGRAARMAISSLTSIDGVPRCPNRTI
jgi:hypothetical protein